jgi:hypothetical protein
MEHPYSVERRILRLQAALNGIGEALTHQDIKAFRSGEPLPSATPKGYWKAQATFSALASSLQRQTDDVHELEKQ